MKNQQDLNINPEQKKQGNVNPGESKEGQQNENTTQQKDDPSSWPAGDKSLEQLLDEDQSMKETRVGGAGNITSGGEGG